MTPITEKQVDYIEIMVNGRFGTAEDTEIVSQYLSQIEKKEISHLSMAEASVLINQLLARDVEYDFICGRKKTVPRWEAHFADQYGEGKACLNHCPADVYFGTCEHFLAYDKAMYEGLNDE